MSRARHGWIQVLQHSAMRCSPSLGPFTPWVGVSPGLLTDTPYPVQQTQPEGRDFSFLSARVTWVIFVRQSLEPRNLGLTTILLSTPLVPTSLEEAEGHTHGARAHSQWYSHAPSWIDTWVWGGIRCLGGWTRVLSPSKLLHSWAGGAGQGP